jgi:hypothetical protein
MNPSGNRNFYLSPLFCFSLVFSPKSHQFSQQSDWKTRHCSAEKLLAKISPTVKAVEINRPPDPDTAHRQERALQVLAEIAAQGRLRLASHNVRILEAEEAEVVGK